MRGLTTARSPSGRPPTAAWTCRFTLHNQGTRRSDEVPQVYLTAPEPAPPDGQFAPRSLVAFDRLSLAPGQAMHVRLHVPPHRLEYWSEAQHRWQRAAGARSVLVGSSSRDIRLTGPLR